MKIQILKLSVFLILLLNSIAVFAQVTSSVSSGRNSAKPELNDLLNSKVQKILDDSGRYFKQGLFHLQIDRRSEAREDFDKAVEVFLMSDVNVQNNDKLLGCYNSLIETLYRLEFLNNQVPMIRSLSGICGWKIDTKLADEMAKKSQSQLNSSDKSIDGTIASSVVGGQNQTDKQNGFTEQTFKASPLDELSKLELIQEESRLQTSKSQQKYVSVTVAKNKSNLASLIGNKPTQTANGNVPIVLKYINDNFNDPYSVKYLKWSDVSLKYYKNSPSWVVSVKLRAKNLYNAYRLSTLYFFIRKNIVVNSIEEDEIDFTKISSATSDYTNKGSTILTNSAKGETWENISNRTGVSVAELKAANGNSPYPVGKVFVPMKNLTGKVPSYSISTNNVMIVKARQDDTVEIIAKRYGANPVEVAKFNGLFVNSKLNVGREIRIPTK